MNMTCPIPPPPDLPAPSSGQGPGPKRPKRIDDGGHHCFLLHCFFLPSKFYIYAWKFPFFLKIYLEIIKPPTSALSAAFNNVVIFSRKVES